MKKFELTTILRQMICAGQTGDTVLLGTEPVSEAAVAKLQSAAQASNKKAVRNNVLFASDKQFFNGIASWGHPVAVICSGETFRWRIFQLDYHGTRYIYGIPAHLTLPSTSLPGINISADELRLLFDTADKNSAFPNLRERIIKMHHPQFEVISKETTSWEQFTFDAGITEQLLRNPTVFKVLEAAVDIQIRALLEGSALPGHLWHFLGDSKDCGFPGSLVGIFDAVTFTTDTQRTFSGPLYLNTKDNSNSVKKQIASFSGQMVVLATTDYSLERELAEDLIQVEHQQHAGCIAASQLKAPIIVLSKKALLSPVVETVDIPCSLAGISINDQWQLRAVTARLLNKDFAHSVFSDWKQWMTSPDAFGIDRRRCWLLCLEKHMAGSLAKLGIDVNNVADVAWIEAQEKERQRQKILNDALYSLEHLNQYSAAFHKKPETKSEVEDILGKNFYCFRHTPSRGSDRGVNFVLFTKESLCRFWKQFDCDEQLYDQALQRTKSDGILAKENYNLTLGNESMRFVWFYAEKCGF